jgi:uncharacterized protein YjbI with pentapeptide repeats
MGNLEHVKILRKGAKIWNSWREKNPEIRPDLEDEALNRLDLSETNLSEANLSGALLQRANINNAVLRRASLIEADIYRADLKKADLTEANLMYASLNRASLRMASLHKANLYGASLIEAIIDGADFTEANLEGALLKNAQTHLDGVNFTGANLKGAVLRFSYLRGADLIEANIKGADLTNAYLAKANLSRANLTGALLFMTNLSGAILNNATIYNSNLHSANFIQASLSGANISNSIIYGISAWDIDAEGIKEQKNLRVTPDNQPAVYVDNLQVAQFVYLLLHNPNIRGIIDTIGEKGVLILGRFTPERKAVLDAIRDKLRELGFVPMMFDFEKPTQRDFTETIKTLAGMSRFIIADITNPKSAPLELQATMPDYMIPLVPIIQQGEEPFSMFVDMQNKFEWVLDVREYPNAGSLLDKMKVAIVKPALEISEDMLMKRASGIRKRRIEEWQ